VNSDQKSWAALNPTFKVNVLNVGNPKWQVRSGTGATENAGVENAIRAKLQGWKMQEWKKREQITGVENAGVSRMERQPDIILRQP